MCRLECPAGVDIPKLMLEAKAAYVADNGLRLGDWVVTRLDLFSSLGCLFSTFTNWAVGNRQARWIMEKAGGIAHGRKLPRFAPRPFMRRASRRRLTRPTRRSGRKVLYFVDTYANYHDPQLAEALVAVLEHNGVAVYVHPDQTQSGMAMVSLGATDRARRVAAHNVTLLADAIRQGYSIICSEPSAALCLSREYPDLLRDDDARLVAENTSEACPYLWNLHLTGKLQLDFKPVNASVGYHMPCHLKALAVGSPGMNLLRLIPGLSVFHVDKGCSGMAGTFGLKRENYRNSLRAGWPLISAVRESTWQAGTTECSACKIQMEQGTSKPTIHPLKLLALAYGLMPEAAAPLDGPRPGADRHMNARVQFFALARQLAGTGVCRDRAGRRGHGRRRCAKPLPKTGRSWPLCCRMCCLPSTSNTPVTRTPFPPGGFHRLYPAGEWRVEWNVVIGHSSLVIDVASE